MSAPLTQRLRPARAHEGASAGIYAVCSAHEWVLEAAMRHAHQHDLPLLVEATCNQVNQFGGYTGMSPADFTTYVHGIAKTAGFDPRDLILGGDHLGPNPWRHLSAHQAMQHAQDMVRAYAQAGFHKLHLDASMACADDVAPLDQATIAQRSAQLCAAAEAAHTTSPCVYVIGTEVPTPGGATESLSSVQPTTPASAHQTVALHQAAFEHAGVAQAWRRVIALVVQPGVEFDHHAVIDYDRGPARALCDSLQALSPLVFEAHSTDYQTPQALRELVQDGFAILKVGPALTFALREGLEALTHIEAALLPESQRSGLMTRLERAMCADPQHWVSHYAGDAAEQALLRRYSLSDRSRYYWHDRDVQAAVKQLLAQLDAQDIPLGLLSQFMPEQFKRVRQGRLPKRAKALVLDKIAQVLDDYAHACNPTPLSLLSPSAPTPRAEPRPTNASPQGLTL